MSARRQNNYRQPIAGSDVDLQIYQHHHHPQQETNQADHEITGQNAGLPPTYASSDVWLNAPAQPKSRQTHYKPFATESPVLFLFLIFTLAFIGGIEGVLRKGVPISVESTLKKINSTQHLLGDSTLPDLGLVNKMVGLANNDISRQEAAAPMSCIGIEMIVSAVKVEQCDTASSCGTTTTEYTYEKPIFNKAISTMPCYICAMETESIEIKGWITATTTHCETCTATSPATIYPCPTCEGTVLAAAPLWETTPTVTAKAHITYAPNNHDHRQANRRL